MFCRNCGYQCADTDNVCANCGTPLRQAPVNPAPPVNQGYTPNQGYNPNPGYNPNQGYNPNPGYTPKPAGTADIKQYVGIGMLVFGVYAVIMAILNLFGLYDVSVSYMGYSSSGSVSDLYEGSSLLMITNILTGLILLAVAAVAVLYGLKDMKNMPYYDQFIAKLPMANKPLTLAGGAAAACGVLQFILYMLCDLGMGITPSVNWTTWVTIILGAGLVCVDMFVINKKK